MTDLDPPRGAPQAVRHAYPHRVLAVIAAALFGLFVVGGVVALVKLWPTTSCAGVPAPTGVVYVQLIGANCVGVASTGPGINLGTAPTKYAGTGWNYARWAIVAWIAWTLAMTLLALAVAKLPGRTSTASAGGQVSVMPLSGKASDDEKPIF